MELLQGADGKDPRFQSKAIGFAIKALQGRWKDKPKVTFEQAAHMAQDESGDSEYGRLDDDKVDALVDHIANDQLLLSL